jgi:hypothetical protein
LLLSAPLSPSAGATRRLRKPQALRELTETHGDGYAVQIAEVHAIRGEADAAFQWLERACAQRDSGFVELQGDVNLLPLHGDPRWAGMMSKLVPAAPLP